jgi:hypothetical protein
MRAKVVLAPAIDTASTATPAAEDRRLRQIIHINAVISAIAVSFS